mmetsp:Transcript_116266/g.201855  ORF Transcript_116266/g.201855 Transcript_116266/m.201855 type:complete len:109 (+) Transcript_116266:357-683(+)
MCATADRAGEVRSEVLLKAEDVEPRCRTPAVRTPGEGDRLGGSPPPGTPDVEGRCDAGDALGGGCAPCIITRLRPCGDATAAALPALGRPRPPAIEDPLEPAAFWLVL